MTDEKKIAQYNMEMAEHADGAAQYLSALIGGRFVTQIGSNLLQFIGSTFRCKNETFGLNSLNDH